MYDLESTYLPQTDPTPPTLPVSPSHMTPPSPLRNPATLCSCGCPHSHTRSSQSPSAAGPKFLHLPSRTRALPMETGLDDPVPRRNTAEVDLRRQHLVCLQDLPWHTLGLALHATCRFVTSELVATGFLGPLAYGIIPFLAEAADLAHLRIAILRWEKIIVLCTRICRLPRGILIVTVDLRRQSLRHSTPLQVCQKIGDLCAGPRESALHFILPPKPLRILPTKVVLNHRRATVMITSPRWMSVPSDV